MEMVRNVQIPEAEFEALMSDLRSAGRGTLHLTLTELNTARNQDIVAVYEDGGGNWIGWSRDYPGLAAFTKRAYPGGEGIECPAGRAGDALHLSTTTADTQADVRIDSVSIERHDGAWWWRVAVSLLAQPR